MVNRDVACHEMGKHRLCLDLGNNAQDGEGGQTIGEKHCDCDPVSQELKNDLIVSSKVKASSVRSSV